MMNLESKHTNTFRVKKFHIYSIMVIILLAPIFALIGEKNILLFHFIMEFLIILMSCSITMMVINTKDISRNNWFNFLGICFGIICIFELCHVIFYEGMNITPYDTSDISYMFSIFESYIRSFAIMVFLMSYYRKLEIKSVIYIFLLIPVLMVTIIFLGVLPASYIKGYGFTQFKIFNEIIVTAILIINILILHLKAYEINRDTRWYIGLATLFAIFSKLFQVFYINKYGISPILTHIFKFISVFLVYRIVVKNTLQKPLVLLNTKLLQKNEELEDTIKKLNLQNEALKKMQEELTIKERTYTNLIENLPLAVILRNDTTILFANNKAVTLFRAKNKEDMIGRNIYDIVHPDYAHIVKREVEESKKGHLLIDSEEKVIRLDGKSIDVEISALPIYDNNKDIFMVVFRDITVKKLSEAMRRELKEAKENERLRTEFFANLSHEFRTPINVIYSSCQLMDMYINKGSIENIDKYNKIIKQNCYRILRLTNNLIDTTLINEGFYKVNWYRGNIVSVVEDIVISVSSYIEDHGVEIIFDTEVEEKEMIFDPEIIERIMLNLLSNAIKYKNQEKGIIEVTIKDKESFVEIYIKDNGRGIPLEKQKAVFERFTRVDRSLNRLEEGSGLGLYIVKSLLKLHKGNILLNSSENEGTEFIIKLPVLDAKEEFDSDKVIDTRSIDEKIKIEFSDIYE